jgi:hypothetical protein
MLEQHLAASKPLKDIRFEDLLELHIIQRATYWQPHIVRKVYGCNLNIS